MFFSLSLNDVALFFTLTELIVSGRSLRACVNGRGAGARKAPLLGARRSQQRPDPLLSPCLSRSIGIRFRTGVARETDEATLFREDALPRRGAHLYHRRGRVPLANRQRRRVEPPGASLVSLLLLGFY